MLETRLEPRRLVLDIPELGELWVCQEKGSWGSHGLEL